MQYSLTCFTGNTQHQPAASILEHRRQMPNAGVRREEDRQDAAHQRRLPADPLLVRLHSLGHLLLAEARTRRPPVLAGSLLLV